MSDTANVDLFKSRLAQLKKVFERDGRIAENLFYAALQLDKNKELKAGVQEIVEKNRLKARKGYIHLPEDVTDHPLAVKALLKDAFEFLLKAFNVDKAQLVQKKVIEPKAHALQLFELQSTLEAQSSQQSHAFESTMEDLDSIDTSTPLEQSVIVSLPPDEVDSAPSEPSIPVKPQPMAVPARPVVPVQPAVVSKHAVAEQLPAGVHQDQKPAVVVLSPTSGVPVKTIPLPPKGPAPVVPVAPAVPVAAKTGVVVQPRDPGTTVVPIPVPRNKPIPLPPAGPKPVPSPPSPTTPAAPAPISYEYYVCNRCGAETSKTTIRQVGAFLECPACKFSFSRAEATVVNKAAQGSGQPAKAGDDDGKKPFNIFESKLPGEDESLVRPSVLFAGRGEEEKPVARQAPPAKPAESMRPKPRVVPTDRLVRPSEYLGLKEEQPPVDAPAKHAAPQLTDAEKIVQDEAIEYFIEPPDATASNKARASPPAERIAEATANEYFEEGVVPALSQQPSPRGRANDAPKPAQVPVQEPATIELPPPGDTCPKCGSSKYSKIQDRNKVISYNPLMYGSKKKCTMCLHEFD